jgi:type I restriction enzyme M protein
VTAIAQQVEDAFRLEALPPELPLRRDLRPCPNLLAVFDDVHNHVYANDGLLKEKIFHEVVELLLLKLVDEQGDPEGEVRFGITARELEQMRSGSAPAFESRIDGLFGEVRARYSELLPDNRRVGLRPATLAYVVAALQRYDLSATPGDAKGQAFQAFVYANQRGDRGEYFTPEPIVRLAVNLVDPRPGETVLDPACGSAGLLVQTIRHVCQSHAFSREQQEQFVRKHVRGMEFNPDVARSAGVRLTFEGGEGHEIQCVDSLRAGLESEGTFDVVVTNPPFGSKGKVTDRELLARYDLGHKWRETDGALVRTRELNPQTPEVLFLELCLRLLKPGGRLAIVLPDGFLQNASTRYIRAWLRQHGVVRAVISVGQEAFVPYGTGIKTSVLIVERVSATSRRGPVFMARFKRIGYDVKGRPVYARDGSGLRVTDETGAPVVDDEGDGIAETYQAWARSSSPPSQEPSCFSVAPEDLNSRLDVEHYLPEDRVLLASLGTSAARPLATLCDFVTQGDRFRKTGEEIRYIALSDIDARTLQVVSTEVIAASDAPSRATYRLRAGDIITATSGASTGTARHVTALITEEEDGCICSNGFAVLRNVRGIDPLFLLAFMRTPVFLRQVRRQLTGHAIPAISLEDLGGVLVPIPSEESQQEIAEHVAALLELRREALVRSHDAVNETTRVLERLGRLERR